MSSSYSSNAATAYSVYGATQVSSVKGKQDDSDVQLPIQKTANDEINDEAIISDKAKELAEKDKETHIQGTPEKTDSTEKLPAESEPKKTNNAAGEKLSPEQQQEVAQLKARDAEVKSHEQAHIAAAAGLSTSAPSFSYQTGPDGKKYAIGGEVSITTPQGNDPEENIRNARTLKAAALAPADPSAQDRAVAANADKIIAANEEKLAEEKQQEVSGEKSSGNIEAKAGNTEKTDNAETNGTIASTA